MPSRMLMEWLLCPTGLDRILPLLGYQPIPLEEQIERKRQALGGQRWPFAAWSLAIAMTGVLISELVTNLP